MTNTYAKHSPDELKKALADKREELRSVRFAGAGSRSRDTKTSAKLRKDIARILTVMTAVAKSAKTK